jgi:aspartyl-tRNA(Asn)/glutamyl-tRNA(Gln) amidotransferase subunit C
MTHQAGQIDQNTVEQIAALCRLRLSDAEIDLFTRQLSHIVEFVAQLSEADVAGVEPTAHPLGIRSAFRDDTPGQPLGAELALANAPQTDQALFKVPRVLEQDSS